VDSYNLSENAVERVQLSVDHKKLVEEYNTLSMLSAYAECMKDATPLVALAKAYYYDTVSVKDAVHNEVKEGVQTSSVTRSVQDGCKKLNIVKFIEWTEEHNKSVAAAKDWRSKMEAARAVVEDEWKKFFAAGGDSHAVSIGKTKRALQAMFDALVFIACENDTDKNAIIANGDIAKWVIGFANSRKDSKADGKITITGSVLPKATWATLQMDILHKAVTGKTYDIIYGDPEEEPAEEAAAEPAAEDEAAAE
jgi:hypothetical protein